MATARKQTGNSNNVTSIKRGFDPEDGIEGETKVIEQTTELGPTTDLEYLKSQRKALDDQIKSMKSTTPGQTKLQRVIEKQHAYRGAYVWDTIAGQTIARIDAGQDRSEAFEAVVTMHLDRANAEIDCRLADQEQES